MSTIANGNIKLYRSLRMELKFMYHSPTNTEEQSLWKCIRCTFCNQYNTDKCEVCAWNKPSDPNLAQDDKIEDNDTVHGSNTKYSDSFSTNLVRGYLRVICNFYLPFKIPFNSTIAHVLSIVVLQFYTFCNFWNMKYTLNHFQFDENDESGRTLILSPNSESCWRNAFSSQRVELFAHYSWSLQIQNSGDYDRNVRCWIGIIESNHNKSGSLRYHNDDLFCSMSFGYGIYGYNGNKRNNDECKPFCKPFKVNDIITIMLQCTRAYYELMYCVNGKYIGCCNEDSDCIMDRNDLIAYRVPNDKVYEMVIALDSSNYKIKCISFDLKPYISYDNI